MMKASRRQRGFMQGRSRAAHKMNNVAGGGGRYGGWGGQGVVKRKKKNPLQNSINPHRPQTSL